MPSPIVLFVYNRPWHTLQTLEALEDNEGSTESILYIYADGPKIDADPQDIKKIEETRSVIRQSKWCKEVHIIERTTNMGLASSIVDGVTTVIDKHNQVIVLEDDIVTSTTFLRYMNDALDAFQDNEEVMHISGYFPDLKKKLPNFFFYNQTSCWGWATWKRAWINYNGDSQDLYDKLQESKRIKEFNLNDAYPFLSHIEANIDGSMKTWAVKWHASVFLKKGLCLHPAKSFVNNIGMDNSGIHCSPTNKFDVKNLNTLKFNKPKNFQEHQKARKSVENFYRGKKSDSLFMKVKKKIKKEIKKKIRI